MTAQQPEALRLADALETEYGSEVLDDAADMLRRLQARVQELEAELVKESGRTAEQKLRADQMSQPHDTQAALNREARAQLAAKQERKPLSEDDVGLWVVRTLCAASKQDKYSTLRNCVPLGSELAPLFLEFARDHGITQEKQG